MPKHNVIEMRRTQLRWLWQMDTNTAVTACQQTRTGYIAAVDTQTSAGEPGPVSGVGSWAKRAVDSALSLQAAEFFHWLHPCEAAAKLAGPQSRNSGARMMRRVRRK